MNKKEKKLDQPEIQLIEPFDIDICPTHRNLKEAKGCLNCKGFYHKSPKPEKKVRIEKIKIKVIKEIINEIKLWLSDTDTPLINSTPLRGKIDGNLFVELLENKIKRLKVLNSR